MIWMLWFTGDDDYPDWYIVYGSKKECVREAERQGFEIKEVIKNDFYPGSYGTLEDNECLIVRTDSWYYGA